MLHNPVGFFDSGWGGLSTLIAAREALPAENFCYVADCGNAPYGDRSHDFIVDRALRKHWLLPATLPPLKPSTFSENTIQPKLFWVLNRPLNRQLKPPKIKSSG